MSTLMRGQLKRGEARARYNLPSEAKIALMVARFVPGKGHETMLEATRIARRALPSFHVLLVGESVFGANHYDFIRRQIEELGLSESITIL
ncbi:MAG: glycosyltransferase, partial [Gammaproteobacteria bacterium]